ncbi:unnamed protein product, partial [Cyprideis torosa]
MIKSNGGSGWAYTVDLSNKADVYRVAALVLNDVGPRGIDILINNAGIVIGRNFLDLPDHLIEKNFQVNIMSHFWTTKSFLPAMMKKDKGHIVTIASMAGHCGVPKLVDYCASKHAAVGFDEALRMELSRQKSRVNTTVVCPYYIRTGMFTGVKSKVFPILKPSAVSDAIVCSVRKNDKELMLPRFWTSMFMVLKSMLPQKGYDEVHRVMGMQISMDDFKGRHQQKSLENQTNGITTVNARNGNANGTYNDKNGGHPVSGINGVIVEETNDVNGITDAKAINGINGINGFNGINGVDGINGVNAINNGVNGIHVVNGINGIDGANGHNDVNRHTDPYHKITDPGSVIAAIGENDSRSVLIAVPEGS